jgi:hypothetical protein
MGNVFTYSMPSGIPGAVNRVGGGGKLDIEAVILDPNNVFPLYGLFGQIDSVTGLFRIIAAADAATYGPIVRPYPTQPTAAAGYSGSVVLGAGAVPPTKGAAAVLKSGYMTVLLYGATAAVKNGQVYVRTQNAGAGQQVGGVEAAADGGNTIAIKAYFMGPADAAGNIEIALNIVA